VEENGTGEEGKTSNRMKGKGKGENERGENGQILRGLGACRRGRGISGEVAGLVDNEKRNLKGKQEFVVCKKNTQSTRNFHGLSPPPPLLTANS
jgi:hypothetical protein